MSTRKSLLLVDSDARSLRVLEVSLRKAGFSVNTAESGASALQWAFTEPPDLVITDTRLPDISGFDLCQRLRSDNRTRLAVVVFLTEEGGPESKIAGINAGADDFLSKPVLVKEIVSRVRTLLEKRRTDSLARRERPGNLSGTLSNMGVVDLLQVMEAGKKSGIVHLSSDPIKSGGFVTEGEERGTIFFRDGEVIDAKLGRLAGLDAVYRMLLWDDGVFEIEFKNIAREDAIQTSTQAILLEGMRQVDEWSRFSDLIPAVNSRLAIDYNALGRAYPEGVPPDTKPVLHLFDGRRTIFEVVSDLPGDDSIALNVIADLHRFGILQGAHREANENAVESWLSSPPSMMTDPSLPSALANAVIPSPETASQIMRRPPELDRSGSLGGSRSEGSQVGQRLQRTALPEPIGEPSLILSRHTVPANRAIPLTKEIELPPAPAPIPLTQTRPGLRIQRVSSVVGRLPTAAPALAEEEDDWEPIRTAPSPVNVVARNSGVRPSTSPLASAIPASQSGAYVIAPAAPPAWPVAAPVKAEKKAEPKVEPKVEQKVEKRERPEEAIPTQPPPPAAIAIREEFEKSSTSEWYSKTDGNEEFAWEGVSSPWRSRLPGLLLVAAVATVVAVLLTGNPRREHDGELTETSHAQAESDPKRAAWPKTDETDIVMIPALAQDNARIDVVASKPPVAAVEPVPVEPAPVTPPPPVAVAAPPPVAVAPPPPVVTAPPPAPPPPVLAVQEKASVKADPAAAQEAVKKGEASLGGGGSLNAARTQFKKAIDADPNNAEAHSGLAMVFVELGNDRAAKTEAQAAIKLDQNQPRAQLVLALIAANGSDMDTAKKYYKKYLQLAPNGKHAEEVRRILKTLE